MRIIRNELNLTENQALSLPSPGKILHVAPGRDSSKYTIDVWSIDGEFEESHPQTYWNIFIYGTGHPMASSIAFAAEFLGTCVMPDNYVWHVFGIRS